MNRFRNEFARSFSITEKLNVETGDIVHRFEGHEGEVTCLSVSKEGKVILSGSSDGTVRRWDGESGESLGEPLRGHKERVSSMTVSGEGKVVISGSWDKTVRRWNGESGESVGKPSHCEGIRSG